MHRKNTCLHFFFWYKSSAPPVFLQICVHVKPPITLWSGFKFISASWILQQILGPFFFFFLHVFFFFLNQRFVQEFLGFECPCRRNVTLKHKPPWHLLTAYGRVCGTVCIQSPDWQAEAQPALTCLLFIPGHFWLTEGVQGRVKEEGRGGFALHNYQLSPIFTLVEEMET